ncbi:curli assembly protein CsgF [Castellaniella defragrans]|uniref:Curli production assembly/transport component CsgF n=1 Tax=Castellaniella defragrans TaxID=75697 RepID=A0A7W9TPH3_CASDE|nr:curli assembly protein CsgF [Castellaniella defragrans]KAB0617096.1 hypothetical protein F7Q88_07795 [Castellaniella defragrans]MBB6084518.1 curli production assembly/transport component CsgF [Castellaniella defragrans]
MSTHEAHKAGTHTGSTGNPHRARGRLQAALAAAGLLLSGTAPAGQLVYVPVNPSFGGNPLNGSYLLQSAQAQKRYPYPLDDLGLDGNGEIKILNAGTAPIIQVGNGVYIYDSTKGQWIPFDLDSLPAGGSAAASSAASLLAPAQSPASIDSGVLQ